MTSLTVEYAEWVLARGQRAAVVSYDYMDARMKLDAIWSGLPHKYLRAKLSELRIEDTTTGGWIIFVPADIDANKLRGLEFEAIFVEEVWCITPDSTKEVFFERTLREFQRRRNQNTKETKDQ